MICFPSVGVFPMEWLFVFSPGRVACAARFYTDDLFSLSGLFPSGFVWSCFRSSSCLCSELLFPCRYLGISPVSPTDLSLWQFLPVVTFCASWVVVDPLLRDLVVSLIFCLLADLGCSACGFPADWLSSWFFPWKCSTGCLIPGPCVC